MNTFFKDVKKNFGFGCMRLPMKDGEVDREELKTMPFCTKFTKLFIYAACQMTHNSIAGRNINQRVGIGYEPIGKGIVNFLCCFLQDINFYKQSNDNQSHNADNSP